MPARDLIDLHATVCIAAGAPGAIEQLAVRIAGVLMRRAGRLQAGGDGAGARVALLQALELLTAGPSGCAGRNESQNLEPPARAEVRRRRQHKASGGAELLLPIEQTGAA
jgi:hypothetical protein